MIRNHTFPYDNHGLILILHPLNGEKLWSLCIYSTSAYDEI